MRVLITVAPIHPSVHRIRATAAASAACARIYNWAAIRCLKVNSSEATTRPHVSGANSPAADIPHRSAHRHARQGSRFYTVRADSRCRQVRGRDCSRAYMPRANTVRRDLRRRDRAVFNERCWCEPTNSELIEICRRGASGPIYYVHRRRIKSRRNRYYTGIECPCCRKGFVADANNTRTSGMLNISTRRHRGLKIQTHIQTASSSRRTQHPRRYQILFAGHDRESS